MSETQAVKPNKMNIAVMVPTLSHSVEYSFTLGLQSCLPVDQYNIIYLPLGWIDANNAGNGQAALLHKALRFSDLHGILIYGAGITNRVKPEYISEITDCYPNVPIINIGNRIPDLASVIIDNRTPFRQFAYHLVKNKGCSRIAFVRGPDDNYDANERYAGFKEGLMECGQSLNPAYDWPGQFSIGSGSLAVQHHFFKADQPPQAIVCANDLSAIGVLTQLIEMGVKVPEDCLVIGFDDLDYSKVIPVPLSSGRYPVFDLGAVAAKLLIDWLQGSAPAAITEISSSVIFRQSTDDDGDPRSQLALLLKDERAFYSRDSNSDRLHINRAIS